MIRVGILGTGAMAQQHLAALRQVAGVRLTAFVDPVIERAQQAAGAVGGQAYASADDAWDAVDAVWICAPHFAHAELCLAAAGAGKHVFVEKPIAHTLAAADAMVAACRRAGVKLMVGQVLRFWPALRALRALVESGALGELTTCWSTRRSGETPDNLIWWRQDWRAGGGMTIQLGSHELDFLRWIGAAAGGQPERVSGEVRFADPAHPYLDTHVRATVAFSNGSVGGFDGGYGFPLGGPIVRAAAGSRGMAVAEGRSLRVRLAGDRADRPVDVARLSGEARPGHDVGVLAEDEAFVRAIAEDTAPPVSGEEGRATLALCLAVHEASRTRRIVAPAAAAADAAAGETDAPRPGGREP